MTTERPNFYQQVHKGIRNVVHGLVERAQRTDFQEPREVAELERALDEAFSIFDAHAAHETAFVTPALRTAAPRLADESDADHGQQGSRLRDLRDALQAAAQAGDAAPRLGHAFVVSLSRFEGEMLVHMADEEESVMPALWAAFDDGTLQAIHEALVASIPPAERLKAFAWMLPALNGPERVELVSGVRATAPPSAFELLRGIARSVLSPADWAQLQESLAVAA